jgi:hypothetical protein
MRSARLRLAPALLVLATSLVAASARAEPLAVLGVEGIDVPETTAARLTDALRVAARERRGVELMPGRDFVEMRLVFNCTDEATLGPCMAQAGRSLVVSRLVLATLRGLAPSGGEGRIAVSLRLIDVSSGSVVRTVQEVVSAQELAAGSVRTAAERWLSGLLVEESAPPPVAPVEPAHPGRTAFVLGSVALVAGLVASGFAIWSWRQYLDSGQQAHDTLALVQRDDPAYAISHTDWFRSPTCDYADRAPASSSTTAYLDRCRSGEHYAAAATGLWIGAGAFLAAGATGLAVGAYALRRATHAERPRSAARDRPTSQLVAAAPIVSGGLLGGALSFSF